jgi:hypothetical protein
MFESKAGVFLIAGLLFFAIAFLAMGLVPWTIYMDEKELTVHELAADGILHEFVDLAERFPDRFRQYFPDGPTTEALAQALTLGRQVYVAEACWHCHSQQVRPVSNEEDRWGPVSHAREYQNVLQRPVLFGTRRVGPDLAREAARRSNGWHMAHFYKPTAVVPTSVMPEYPWFFDEEGYPNERGFAIITYVQWLGSWLDKYPYYYDEGPGEPHNADNEIAAAPAPPRNGDSDG